MQYGRESDNDARKVQPAAQRRPAVANETKGWICSVTPDHFRTADRD
jgi:hypothetical protein